MLKYHKKLLYTEKLDPMQRYYCYYYYYYYMVL